MRLFLHKLMVDITRHPREIITPAWSPNSLAHNVFRVYEYLFGRRAGIRTEQISDSNGNVYSYTWENLFATYEGIVRSWIKGKVPKFSIVYLPQLQLAGLAQGGVTPFRFAIAFDAASSGDAASNTLTYNHTCTGTNLTLVSSSGAFGVTPAISSILYNSVSLTSALMWSNQTFQKVSLYYLAAPSTGTNSMSITMNSTPGNNVTSVTISMTGTNASPLGNLSTPATSAGVPATSFSNSITTGTANSWVIAGAQGDDTAAHCAYVATGTGQTVRTSQTNNVGGQSLVISTQTTTTAGSYTSGFSMSVSVNWQIGCIEIIAGAAPAVVSSGFITTMAMQ